MDFCRARAESLRGRDSCSKALGLEGRTRKEALLLTLTHIKTPAWISICLVIFEFLPYHQFYLLIHGKFQQRSSVCSKEATQPPCTCTGIGGAV